jgi:hypothetical protein
VACHYIYNVGAVKAAIPSQVFLWIGINNINVDEKRTAVMSQIYVVSVQMGRLLPKSIF